MGHGTCRRADAGGRDGTAATLTAHPSLCRRRSCRRRRCRAPIPPGSGLRSRASASREPHSRAPWRIPLRLLALSSRPCGWPSPSVHLSVSAGCSPCSHGLLDRWTIGSLVTCFSPSLVHRLRASQTGRAASVHGQYEGGRGAGNKVRVDYV